MNALTFRLTKLNFQGLVSGVAVDHGHVRNRSAKRAVSGSGEAGFTLIELLVVMLILGILAAIALPAFFNQKQKAGDAKAKEYAHSGQVAMETYSTDHNGTYVGVSPAELVKIEPTLSSAELTVKEASAKSYELVSESSNGHEFIVKNEEGTMKFKCTPRQKGGCPASGNWAE